MFKLLFDKSYRKSFLIQKKLKKLIKLIKQLDKLDWNIYHSKGLKTNKIFNSNIGVELVSDVISIDYNNEPIISIPKTMLIFEPYYNEIEDFINLTIADINTRINFSIDYDKLDKAIFDKGVKVLNEKSK